MTDYSRNPIVIFVFTVIGMTIRFVFFYCVSFVRGEKSKSYMSFSNGFHQIVYNLLLTLGIFMGVFFSALFYLVATHPHS